MKAGDLVKYKSRLLLVLGMQEDNQGYTDGWYRCMEVDTSRVRIYHPTQLTIIKSPEQFYL
jgi:hypothetical protein